MEDYGKRSRSKMSNELIYGNDLISVFDVASTLIVDKTYRATYLSTDIIDFNDAPYFKVVIKFKTFSLNTIDLPNSLLSLSKALLKNLTHLADSSYKI